MKYAAIFLFAFLASCKSNDNQAPLYWVDVPLDSTDTSGFRIYGHACIYGSDCLCLKKTAISKTAHDDYLVTVYDSVTYIFNHKNHKLTKQKHWWLEHNPSKN